MKINPSRELPALLMDGEVLTQSAAIMEYLEETRAEVSLLPVSSADKAKVQISAFWGFLERMSEQPFLFLSFLLLLGSQVRQIVQIICSDTQPVQNARVLNYVGNEKKLEWAKYWITWNFEGEFQTLAPLCAICADSRFAIPSHSSGEGSGEDLGEVLLWRYTDLG